MQDSPLSLVLSELKRLKKEGVKALYLSEETLKSLSPSHHPQQTLHLPSRQVINPSPMPEKSLSLEPSPNISIPKVPTIELPKGSKHEQWAYLKNLVLSCEECKRHVKPGKHVVFGVGNVDADVFFCGEAPGADEETEGVPFVGRAGQLLTKMIQGMGLSREAVYIANIMNWRPEMDTPVGNRPPTQKEMEFCLPYLKAQVALIKPKVIVALGATAVNGLLGVNPKRKIGDIRGQWQSFEGTPLMVTFHPSYLLRNNTNRTKRQVWEDLLAVMEALKLPISEKQRNYFL